MPPFAVAARAAARLAGFSGSLGGEDRVAPRKQPVGIASGATAAGLCGCGPPGPGTGAGDPSGGPRLATVAAPPPKQRPRPAAESSSGATAAPVAKALAAGGAAADGVGDGLAGDGSDGALCRDIASAVVDFLYGSDDDELPPGLEGAEGGEEVVPVHAARRGAAARQGVEDVPRVFASSAVRLAHTLRAQGVTTMMIRNIPAAATQAAFLEELTRTGFSGFFDFCYLPCVFETRANKGYAFINLISGAAVERFVIAWHGSRRLGTLPSERPLNVSAAAVQGREENVRKWGSRVRRIRSLELRPYIPAPEDLFHSPEVDVAALPGWQQGLGCSGPSVALLELRPPPGLPPPPHLTARPAAPASEQRAGPPIGAPPEWRQPRSGRRG